MAKSVYQIFYSCYRNVLHVAGTFTSDTNFLPVIQLCLNFIPDTCFFSCDRIFLPVTGNFFLQYKINSCDTQFFTATGQNAVTFAKILCETPRFRGNQDPRFPVKIPPCPYCASNSKNNEGYQRECAR